VRFAVDLNGTEKLFQFNYTTKTATRSITDLTIYKFFVQIVTLKQTRFAREEIAILTIPTNSFREFCRPSRTSRQRDGTKN